jgi:hypothetical protein
MRTVIDRGDASVPRGTARERSVAARPDPHKRRKLNEQYQAELGADFTNRLQGTRIKHRMGPVATKLCDNLAVVLRITTTVNDLTFFEHCGR